MEAALTGQKRWKASGIVAIPMELWQGLNEHPGAMLKLHSIIAWCWEGKSSIPSEWSLALLIWIMEGTFLTKDSELHIAFLNWRKAFDKVNRRGPLSTRRCIGVPEEMCKAVEGIYQAVRFLVSDCGALQCFWHTTRLPSEPLPLNSLQWITTNNTVTEL